MSDQTKEQFLAHAAAQLHPIMNYQEFRDGLKRVMDAAEQRAYLDGVKSGLAAFAWWKDGTQYVGTCGNTLKQALELADKGELYGQRQRKEAI